MVSIRNASDTQLQAEIKRRETAAARLQKKHDKLAAQLAAVAAQLSKLGKPGRKASRSTGTQSAGRSAGSRKRPKNELTLFDALAACADVGAVVSPQEAADLVKKNGYQTTSATFGGQVANALAKHSKFKKKGRAQYKRMK